MIAEANRNSARPAVGPGLDPIAAALAQIGYSATDPAVGILAAYVAALHDRLLYCESALHHVAELVGLDLAGLPDAAGKVGAA